MASGLPLEHARGREAPDDGEIRVPDEMTFAVNTRTTRAGSFDEDDGHDARRGQ
jgi:hypothetical protein